LAEAGPVVSLVAQIRLAATFVGHIQVPHGCIPTSTGKHLSASSVQATPPQVVGYDDIRDSIKDKLDVVGVRSAGHMGVDLFVGRLVLALILRLNVGDSLKVGVRTCR